MKFTEDQKRVCNGIGIYAITDCIVLPMIHIFKGDFSWSDTILYVAVTIAAAIIVGSFLIIGMKTPKQ